MVLETLVAPTVWSGLAVVSVGEPMGQPVTARVLGGDALWVCLSTGFELAITRYHDSRHAGATQLR